MRNIAIIGLGNLLRRDDAIGVILLEELRGKFEDIEFIDCNIEGANLLQILSKFDNILILDAVDFGSKPGEYRVFDVNSIDQSARSTHVLNLREMVMLSRVMYKKPRRVYLFGIQPEDTSPGMELSRSLSDKKSDLIGAIEETIKLLRE